MKIKIKNSKIKVAGKTIIDNRGKEDVVLHSVVCILCDSIKQAGDLINKPVECGKCGKVHE
jgi:hypothetical protein